MRTIGVGSAGGGRAVALMTGVLLLAPMSLLGASPAAAATPDPTVSYAFAGTLSDSLGASTLTLLPDCPSGTPRSPCNSASGFGSDADGPYWEWSSTDPRGGGFTVLTDALVGDTYTIALKFSFANVTGYRKIIDYADWGSDNGFYFYDGGLEFFPGPGGTTTYAPNEVVDLVAVRDASVNPATFTVYAVGEAGVLVQLFSYDDDGNDAIPETSGSGSLLGFFFDDGDTSSEATPNGKVYGLKIWSNIALTAQEIDDVVVNGSGNADQGPPDVLQQIGVSATGSCDAIADADLNWGGAPSGGWTKSWAEWALPKTGGWVCTRTLYYSTSRAHWSVRE